MKYVQPIRDKTKIHKIKNILKKNNYRDYFLFVLGINSGLRVSDMLKLKVMDVKNKSHIAIKERKNGKLKRFKINNSLQGEISEYIWNMNDYDYLFPSRKGETQHSCNQGQINLIKYMALKNCANERIRNII